MLVRPDVKARQRNLARQRTRALRQRKRAAKQNKINQRRCYRVWMTDADVLALLHDVELPQQNQLSPRELHEHFDQKWVELAGSVIEQAALLAIKKHRK
jgi:hypothetical protein